VDEGLVCRGGLKAALASLALLVVMLLVILTGLTRGWLWIGVLSLGVLSTAFAIVAIGGALTGKDIESGRRLLIVLIALPGSLPSRSQSSRSSTTSPGSSSQSCDLDHATPQP
jgi:hypothetical protein